MDQKFNYEVDYPVKRLNMNRYIPDGQIDDEKYIYSLRAVICHSGSIDRGNYYTMGQRKGEWSLFDKQSRITITDAEAVSPEAYILIYDSDDASPKKR